MSEPSSVYARIHISKANLEKFLAAKIQPVSNYDDWLTWLGDIEY